MSSPGREAAPFDLAGPRPLGVTVLEASAGTGKTYAIATLAARYVAEGTPLARVLLVTFTRMATGELRERVRERLAEVERDVRRIRALPAGGQVAGHEGWGAEPDPVVELLARGSDAEVSERCRRLRRALADFDAATIATIHGFCQEVLGGLGVAADLDPDADLVEDLSDLLGETLDDLYLRRFLREQPAFPRGQAMTIAQLAVENPEAPIVPVQAEVPAMRRRLALAVRRELAERKRRRRVMSYDDLLDRLVQALSGPHAAAVGAHLRDTYDVVLVDEFQDTDPVQWEIMRRAFGQGDGALVLIADPKQAIYGFRGADVYAYLDAAQSARQHSTLRINRRSDQALLDAYDVLFANARLGHEGIAYRRVQAAASGRERRLRGAPRPAPLRIRIVDRQAVELTRSGFAETQSTRAFVAADLACEVVKLLSSPATVQKLPGARAEPICPGHLAVLVPRNNHATLVRQALEQAGVPAVTGGAGSVFETPAAAAWLRLLEALEQPGSATRAHALALSVFLGWSPAQIASAGEEEWGAVHRRLHEWASTLRAGGVASLLETASRAERLGERLLGQTNGERELTDLRHVAQLLHGAAHEEQLGLTALTGWLRRRMTQAERESAKEDRSRRLESDAQAVQVLTIHRSKGLEFPIVLAPYLWDMGRVREGEPVCFHDPDAGNARWLDVSLEGREFAAHRRQSIIEARGEDLRLAYVALTRARHQALLWWAGSYDSRNSPLGRLVFARREDGTVEPYGSSTPTDEGAWRRFRELADEAPDRISLEPADLGPPLTWSPSSAQPADLHCAQWDRKLDRWWRRTSYSDMTAAAHEADPAPEALVASEPEAAPGPGTPAAGISITDEPSTPPPALPSVPPPGPLAARSPLDGMPAGPRFGTLVHEVLQDTDFTVPDLEAELARALAGARSRDSLELTNPAAMVAGLRAVIATPLGPLLGGIALRDIAPGDRLDELGFELPLAGGDRPHPGVGDRTAALTPRVIAATLREYLPEQDPLAGYAERLLDPALRERVRGYLTGFLDLVVRLPGSGEPRFAVLDYKTNRLGAPDSPLTLWDYRPEVLWAEMERRHYPLQALLYLVALHRFLRWRVPGYDPDRHLAGVIYAFVRGMSGTDAPLIDGVPPGVFSWRPPGELVGALSDALDSGAGAGA